ncbi:inverted formin-2-like [Diadema antillarum]|uniref:inverted formin-2-like n=1 Tax=Diadema antillarum TaxID=105358 RepID=UPI003A8933F2
MAEGGSRTVLSSSSSPSDVRKRSPAIPSVRVEQPDDADDEEQQYADDTHAASPESAGSDEAPKRNSAANRWLIVRSHFHKEADGGSVSPVGGTGSPSEGPTDPRSLIALIQTGSSVQSYTRLKRQLKRCDRQWVLRFLELRGLELLYLSLQRLSAPGPGRPGRRSPRLADAFAQIECVACFKAVMDSQAGLEYIIEDTEFTRKLANALDTENAPVKKQVYELLSALCMYSADGYSRAIDALEHYKVSQSQIFAETVRFELYARPITVTYT